MFGIFTEEKKLDPPKGGKSALEAIKSQAAIKVEKAASANKTPVPQIIGEKCPECGHTLIVRKNSLTDRLFVGCSNFPKCKHTMSVAYDMGSTRGNRGVSELCNGVTVYYAENWMALRGYKGMKHGDIGVIKNSKNSFPQHFIFTDSDDWVFYDMLNEDVGEIAEDYFEDQDDDEEDDDY